MGRYLLLLSLVLTAAAALAVDVPALIEAAPPVGDFAADDVVVLYQNETIDVADDLSVTRRVHTVRRLQTQWAIRRLADVRVAWDSARQDLEVVTSRTFMVDGAVRETPDNGFNEVTPDAVARAVPFMEIREMVITHIGTEPGCVVELEYVVRDREPAALPPSGRCWLGGDHPVLTAECELRGLATITSTVGADADHGRATVSERPSYGEVGGRQRTATVPQVTWGVGPDTVAEDIRRHTDTAAVAGPLLQAWVAAVRNDSEVLTDGDFMVRLATLIHDEIANVRLPAGQWSRGPRSAEAVFSSGVGTPWERAVVAMAALRNASYAPELGLFGRPDGASGTSDRNPYSHLRTVVQAGRNNWWLAPDHGDAWTGNCDLAGFQGCFLSADGSQRQYQVPGQVFACRWNLTVSPAEDGWQAVADLEYDDLATPVADPRQLAERMAGRILDDGEVADFELRESSRRNLALRFRVEGTGLATLQDGLGWYTMPWPDLDVVDDFLEGIDRSRAVRHTVLAVDHDASVDGTFTLELPSGWSVDSPGPRDVSYTEAPLTLEYRTEALSRGLKQVVHLRLAPGQVEADRWPEFRQALTDVVDLSAEALVIVTDR